MSLEQEDDTPAWFRRPRLSPRFRGSPQLERDAIHVTNLRCYPFAAHYI